MKHLDAPFWMAVLAGLLLVGSIACFGIAFSAQADCSAHLAASL